MAKTTLDHDGMMKLVEEEVRTAWTDAENPHDVSPSELHQKLGANHPEIAEMSKSKFHGAYVRLVKLGLQREGLAPPQREGNSATERATRAVRSATRTRAGGGGTSPNRGTTVDKEALRVALFDFASEFVHAESASERITRLQNIDSYVDRIADTVICR
jgi:hypothetical protein